MRALIAFVISVLFNLGILTTLVRTGNLRGFIRIHRHRDGQLHFLRRLRKEGMKATSIYSEIQKALQNYYLHLVYTK